MVIGSVAALPVGRRRGMAADTVAFDPVPPRAAGSSRGLTRIALRSGVQHRYAGWMRAAVPVLPLLVAALGIASYGVMDALMKGLALGIGAYSALVWRVGAGTAITAVLYLGSRPRRPQRHVLLVHAGRSVLVAAMALAFFWGIARVPLAEAVALSFIAPLIALGLAALFLREAVGWQSVAASVLGLVGVAIVMAGRLGVTHGPDTARGMAAVLVSAILYAANLVVARHQAQQAGPVEIAFWQNLFVLTLLLVGAAWLVRPIPGQGAAIGAAAVLAVVSLLLLSWAYARAEARVLVSVEYTAFIWAALMGWWWFGEELTPVTLAGTALIIAGCAWAARTGGAPALPQAEASA
jgi:S-adenosylmethionine uptake transporter